MNTTESHMAESEQICRPCRGTGSRLHGWAICPGPCQDCGGSGRAPKAEPDRYVVTGPGGFTETFNAEQVDLLVRLGLIEHERDGHVLADGQGRGVGPLHHFYKEARRG